MHSACASGIGTWPAIHFMVRWVVRQESYRVLGCHSEGSKDGISNPGKI
jgi:hypothetical protein